MESRIDGCELDEAADQQAGAGQEHHRQRHLGHDERAAHAVPPRFVSAPRPPSFRLLAILERVDWNAGTMPKTTPVSNDSARLKSTTVPLTLTSSSLGMPRRMEADEERDTPDGEQQAQARADQAEHDALGQQLADEAHALGAERGAYRHLALAGRGARKSRFATLAQAISSTKPTAPRST